MRLFIISTALFFAEIKTMNVVLRNSDDLSLTGPHNAGMLANYSQYGTLDVGQNSVSFCRHQSNQMGAIWSKRPSSSEDWQFTASIKIKGDVVGGNGLAFWYVKDGHGTGPVFGAPDKWTGLALMIDTFDDDNHSNNPAIVGMMNDGSMEYKANQDGEGQYFSGCLRNVRNLENHFKLRCTFMKNFIKVEINDKGDDRDWVSCFEKHGIVLPPGYFFGASASTNDFPDTMEILDMQVNVAVAVPDDGPHAQAMNSASPGGASGSIGNKSITSSMDAEALIKLVEASVQRQMMQMQPFNENRFGALDGKMSNVNESLQALSKVIELHSINNQKAFSQQPSHDGAMIDVQNTLNELKARIDSLQETMNHFTSNTNNNNDDGHYPHNNHGKERDHMMNQSVNGEKLSSGTRKWFIFFAVQVVILGAFLAIKNKLDSREKKLL